MRHESVKRDHLLREDVLRRGHTEPGGSGDLLYCFDPGRYLCAGCGALLFKDIHKYDSGTGWPAFHTHHDDGLSFRDDPLFGMKRLEAVCASCGGHLGHLFDDPESTTGQRYCINSAGLLFEAAPSV